MPFTVRSEGSTVSKETATKGSHSFYGDYLGPVQISVCVLTIVPDALQILSYIILSISFNSKYLVR